MESPTFWFTVLAIVASVLSAGGIVSQVIAWLRSRDAKKTELAKVKESAGVEKAKTHTTGKIELAKIAMDSAIDEREQSKQFQQRLLNRLEKLEKDRDADETRLADLEKAKDACEAINVDLILKLDVLSASHRTLLGEHESLKTDHEMLRADHDSLRADNKKLRARLTRLDHEADLAVVEPEETTPNPRVAKG